MAEFELFRLKLVTKGPPALFDRQRDRRELLNDIIESRPEAIVRRGHWHIGNLERLGDAAVYFALGRTTQSTVSLYDVRRRDFVQTAFENAPYTHCIVDVRLELCAIAHNSKLAPTTAGIARRFARVLNAAPIVAGTSTQVEVVELRDPDEFLALLRQAYAIKRFAVTFSRPNPFDANQDLQRPLEEALQHLNGEAGKVIMKGESLDEEYLAELTRSAASTGNAAEATILRDAESRPIRRSLLKTAVVIAVELVDGLLDKMDLLRRMRREYTRVRDEGEDA